MITKQERLGNEIKELKRESESLKDGHEWGNWENWRKFIKIDQQINEYRIELLKLENEAFDEALETYKDY